MEDPRTRLLFAATERADRMDKEKDLERTRHRDRKRRRPSDSDEEEDKLLSHFGEGSSREGTTTLRAQALKHQGKLYLDGLAEINRFLASRGEPGAEGDSGGRMVAYLTSVFHGHYSAKEVGPRDSRELRTLAEALDALAAGNLPAVGDLLMQRFKEVECKIQDGGDWGTASHLELISDRQWG